MKLLRRIERGRVGDVADIEVGNHAEHALFLFDPHLLLRDFNLAEADLDFGKRVGDVQGNEREIFGLSGVERAGKRFGSEAVGGNRERVGPRGQAGKEKLAVGAGEGFAVLGRITLGMIVLRLTLLGDLYVGSGDNGARLIDNDAGDGAGGLRI